VTGADVDAGHTHETDDGNMMQFTTMRDSDGNEVDFTKLPVEPDEFEAIEDGNYDVYGAQVATDNDTGEKQLVFDNDRTGTELHNKQPRKYEHEKQERNQEYNDNEQDFSDQQTVSLAEDGEISGFEQDDERYTVTEAVYHNERTIEATNGDMQLGYFTGPNGENKKQAINFEANGDGAELEDGETYTLQNVQTRSKDPRTERFRHNDAPSNGEYEQIAVDKNSVVEKTDANEQSEQDTNQDNYWDSTPFEKKERTD